MLIITYNSMLLVQKGMWQKFQFNEDMPLILELWCIRCDVG